MHALVAVTWSSFNFPLKLHWSPSLHLLLLLPFSRLKEDEGRGRGGQQAQSPLPSFSTPKCLGITNSPRLSYLYISTGSCATPMRACGVGVRASKSSVEMPRCRGGKYMQQPCSLTFCSKVLLLPSTSSSFSLEVATEWVSETSVR
jgi:hypothetical protein